MAEPGAPHEVAQESLELGRAVRARREALGLTQARLAELLGVAAAQTVSEIEKGRREVKAHELVRVARALHTDVDVLLGLTPIDPPTRVLWRRGTKPDDQSTEMQLLERAHRYAQLEEWCGEEEAEALPNLQFDPRNANRVMVAQLADQVRKILDLGSIPAAALQRTLEDAYGVKIFSEPLGNDQAGACVRSGFGSVVLLNSADVPWRRNFSLAHELFHLVTWEAVEKAWGSSPTGDAEPVWYEKLEKLADHFASRLLLPGESVLARVNAHSRDKKLTFHSIASIAADFEVSAQAFLFRLLDLGVLDRDAVRNVTANEEFRRVCRDVFRAGRRRIRQHWYPARYRKLAIRAYQRGVVGKSIVAKYLELPYAEVETLDLGQPHASEAALSFG